MSRFLIYLIKFSFLLVLSTSVLATQPPVVDDQKPAMSAEELKRTAMSLNRDLMILEENLLYPSSTRIQVLVSMNVGRFYELRSIRLTIDDVVVASHLYTENQNKALVQGGLQPLYMGNVKSGTHDVTAILTGVGPQNREYKRAVALTIEKNQDPKVIELKIRDSSKNMEPHFELMEWEK